MKKYLVAFVIGTILVGVGIAMMVYDLKDFRFIETDDYRRLSYVNAYTYRHDHQLDIDDHIKVRYVQNDALADNEIRIYAPVSMRVKEKGNELEIDYDGFDFHDFQRFYDPLLSNLKNKVWYYSDDYDQHTVVIEYKGSMVR